LQLKQWRWRLVSDVLMVGATVFLFRFLLYPRLDGEKRLFFHYMYTNPFFIAAFLFLYAQSKVMNKMGSRIDQESASLKNRPGPMLKAYRARFGSRDRYILAYWICLGGGLALFGIGVVVFARTFPGAR